MTDIKSSADPLFLRDAAIREGIELLFFAYRDFVAEPDSHLATLGMGRAHHRAIHFIGRHPGMTVGELLAILKVTKQSLSRVLSLLIDDGYVEQKLGDDRRRRHLHLTGAGRELENILSSSQRKRFARAYGAAGAEAVEGFRTVLAGLMDPQDEPQT
ncbi:MAG: MarR family transcriptional regulator [Pseudomonadota bacterium]